MIYAFAVEFAQLSCEFCNETDRHSMLLSLYISELDRPGRTDEESQALLQQWRKVPGTFSSLRIRDAAEVESLMSPSVRDAFKSSQVAFYPLPDPNGDEEVRIWGAAHMRSTAAEVLTGCCEWRADRPLSALWAAQAAVMVYHANGAELFRHAPPELADWRPAAGSTGASPYKVRHGGKTWHVAEAVSRTSEVRFITATSAKTSARVNTGPACLFKRSSIVSFSSPPILTGRDADTCLLIE